MKFAGLIVVALFYIAGSHASEEIQEEDGVLVITKSNFEQATKDHEFILFEFCKYFHFSLSPYS